MRPTGQVVIEMIAEKKAKGVALLGIFHDQDVRDAVADRIIDVSRIRAEACGVRRMTKLSETPLVHETAKVVSKATLGRYTEVAERVRMMRFDHR
jgi:hypothetical protein